MYISLSSPPSKMLNTNWRTEEGVRSLRYKLTEGFLKTQQPTNHQPNYPRHTMTLFHPSQTEVNQLQ